MRRNKEEMQKMRSLVNSYLIANDNNPQKAYNDYITYFSTNNILLPYYVLGLKDFIKLSKDKKHNEILIREEIKKEKETNKKYKSEDKIKDIIINLSFEEIKEIWESKKNNIGREQKAILGYLYIGKKTNKFEIKEFTNADLRNLKEVLL